MGSNYWVRDVLSAWRAISLPIVRLTLQASPSGLAQFSPPHEAAWASCFPPRRVLGPALAARPAHCALYPVLKFPRRRVTARCPSCPSAFSLTFRPASFLPAFSVP